MMMMMKASPRTCTASSRRVNALPQQRREMRVLNKSTTTDNVQPAWTGDNVVSRLVNWMINTKPLYAIMKVMAKQAIKNSAEEKGISWDGHVRKLQAQTELMQIKEELECKDMVYPSYYLQPFHAYDEGNLNWEAAYEVDPATYSMSLRTFKEETSPEAAFVKLRAAMTDAIKAYLQQNRLAAPSKVVDVGCSTGISARWLAQEFGGAEVTGMDLSAYFLAVAELAERQHEAAGGKRRVTYVHRKVEDSGLPDQSVDLMSFQFVIHECPQETIRDFIKESKRVLKPGGVLFFEDNNPRSKTIQNLPPALFTLMKSTEPWSDQYFSFDLEAAMREAGFKSVVTVETDHRHRGVMGYV